jgi:hypothetical protein
MSLQRYLAVVLVGDASLDGSNQHQEFLRDEN